MYRPPASVVGLFAGLLLALGILIDGFFGFILLALFGTIGVVVGRVIDGDIDVTAYLDRGRTR
jgi:uncharacterized membrane protein